MKMSKILARVLLDPTYVTITIKQTRSSLSSCVLVKEKEHSIADFGQPGPTDLMVERTSGSCDTKDTNDSAAATSSTQKK